MKVVKTQIMIKARPEKIWHILQDVNLYATWNPFIIYAKGNFDVGEKFSFILKAPGEKPKWFRSSFKKIIANQELRWLKQTILPGIYNTEHIIRLRPTSENETAMEYEQRFSGLIGWWFFNRFEYSYLAGMKKMNQTLKEMCEKEEENESNN